MHGFSLIELIVFIVVIGIAVTAISIAFSTASQNDVGANAQTTANNIAAARMEFILGQASINGYLSFSDLCAGGSPPAVCTLPAALSAYTVSSSIAGTTIGGDSNYKIITVTVSGPQSAAATLKALVGS